MVDVEDFVNRLTSRKFWLTIAVCVYFMWRGEPAFASLTQVIIAFLAIQGGTDALTRFAEVRMTNRPSTQTVNPLEGALDPSVMNAAQNIQTGPISDSIPSGPVPPGG